MPKRLSIDRSAEQVLFAEELGFYSAWLAEHHFTRYSIGSSSLILATNLAARTKTIRLGTAVLVSPLHNPLRLAEDTATLDLISGGRLDVGFGRGSGGYEYHGYNINADESLDRFKDSVNMVQGLWTTPDFTYSGQHFQVNRANLVPMPIQKPHPPIYLAATRTPATLDFTAFASRWCRTRRTPWICASASWRNPKKRDSTYPSRRYLSFATSTLPSPKNRPVKTRWTD